MSLSSVSGVGVLIPWHVGHGSFETLQDLMPHLAIPRRIHAQQDLMPRIISVWNTIIVTFQNIHLSKHEPHHEEGKRKEEQYFGKVKKYIGSQMTIHLLLQRLKQAQEGEH